jgi:hypothetical protein
MTIAAVNVVDVGAAETTDKVVTDFAKGGEERYD